MALIASLFIPVVISYSFFFYSRIGHAFEEADEEEGILSSIVQENLTGVRVVRAFGRESYEQSRFHKQNDFYTAHWIRLMRILTANWVTGDVMTGIQLLRVIAAGTSFCVSGRITAGEFIAFISYFNQNSVGYVHARVISDTGKIGEAVS
ncbi:MAG: hypothetical protein IJJ38_09345 [Lachnospiraceae bacterium]|nr:hypothetical protein [Lachnospiraceae bacterium]